MATAYRRRCARCYRPLVRKTTGRPPRYCTNACRQAGFRRVTKLRAPTAERVLLEHGLDADRLRALIYRCLQSNLNRRGAYLAEDRFGECLDHLVLVAVATAAKYDPSRSRPGTYKFESYIWDILEKRIIDWWRANIGDFRFPELLEQKTAFRSALPLDSVDEDAHGGNRALSAEDEYDLSLDDAVVELGSELTPTSAWALAALAKPLAEGSTITDAALEAGVSTHRARLALAELREEISAA